MKQVLNGSEIVLECLKEQGVDTVFGYPGGAILNIYDELYKQSDKIHHVLTSHEQGASHAADGYARATGKVGVCMATSGPGATNLVTGLATAYMDSIPVVAITANVGVSLLGKDSFQEIDIKGVTMPVTKHNYIVKDIEKLADTIREAFQIAQSGRKGPVLVDITKDVTAAKTYFESMEPAVIHPVCETIKEKSVKEAIEMIEDAKSKGYEVTCNIMAISNTQESDLDQALDMVAKSSADGIYIVDSYGALYPEQIRRTAEKYTEIAEANGKFVGMHAHNNQQLAFANTIEAAAQGVSLLDATMMGMGRGAGNCAMELLLSFLKNPKYNVFPVLKFVEEHMLPLKESGAVWGYDIPYLLTGRLNQHPSAAIDYIKSGETHYADFYTDLLDK